MQKYLIAFATAASAPSSSVKLDALRAGEWAIGKEKIQEVDKDAQKIVVHLKSCCISQQSGFMKPEQYQVCINGAKDYEAKIIQITNIIGEAQADKQEGKTELVDQKAAPTGPQRQAISLLRLQREDTREPVGGHPSGQG